VALETDDLNIHPRDIRDTLSRLHDEHRAPTPWDGKVERLLNGLRDPHLYIGRTVRDGIPWLLQLALLKMHGHIIGGSGTGKTALCLAPLAFQLIARGDASVVILDLKGDRALFWGAFIEAVRAGLPFRWFNIEPGAASFAYNPLTQNHERERTLNARAQGHLSALGLDHGDDYGAGWFTADSLNTLTSFLGKFDDIRSYSELSRYADEPSSYIATKTDPEASQHLRMVLRQLAAVAPLNLTESSRGARPEVLRDAIQMTDVLSRPQVVHFNLPSMEEEQTAKSIARQIPFGLVQAAKIVGRTRKPVPVYLIVDEAQQVLTQRTKIILEMARSMGVYTILAHQSMDQLRSAHWDITSVVEGSTTFKLNFEASSLAALKSMVEHSIDVREPTLSYAQPIYPGFDVDKDDSFSPRRAYPRRLFEPALATVGEVYRSELSKAQTLAMSAHPLRALVRSRTDGGLTQYAGRWIEIECQHPITKKEYEERDGTPFPAEHPSCITVESSPPPKPSRAALTNKPLPVKAPPRSVDSAITARLEALRDSIGGKHAKPDGEA
jgi:hypothetical protein